MCLMHLDERARSSFFAVSLFLLLFTPLLTVFSDVANDNLVVQAPLEDLAEKEKKVPEIEISIVSPLNSESVSGLAVVIAVIQPISEVTSAWFEINGKELGELYKEKNFSSDFNTFAFVNGAYTFSVHACIGDYCSFEAIEIEINNQELQPTPAESPTVHQDSQTPEPTQQATTTPTVDENQAQIPSQPSEQEPEKKYSIRPSNIFSAAVFYDDKNEPIASGTDTVYVPAGTYNVSVSFFEFTVSEIKIAQALIESDAMLFEVDGNIDVNSITFNDQNFYLKEVIAFMSGLTFNEGSATFRLPPFSDAIFVCEDWDFQKKECGANFTLLAEVSGAEATIPFSQGQKAFVFAEKYEEEIVPPDFNADDFEKDLPESKIKKSGKKHFLLSKPRQKYLANEMPVFEFQALNDINEAADVEIEAYLIFPDGTETQIEMKKIQKKAKGLFNIIVPVPRSFKAGRYNLKVKIFDGNEVSEHSSSFEWGLVAVNTEKSIYAPNETAVFHIVVLDPESYGVSGAEVNLGVLFPDGETQTISTIDGTIAETTSAGVYIGEMRVGGEGIYKIMVQAKAPNIDAEIHSSFEVRQNVPFEIIRRAATKIDPAVQPNKVEIFIKASDAQKKITAREFVPAEFEIEKNKNFSIKTKGKEKIIEWKDVEFNADGEAKLTYYYSVPDRKPWLYNIGPIEIDYKAGAFTEARAWMIAVDANPTTIFFYRRSADWVPREPMPNAGQLPHYLLSSSWAGFGMNDVAGTTAQCHNNPSPGPTGSGAVALAGFTSPPLVTQSISATTWRITSDMNESAANDNAYPYTILMKWNRNDTPGTIIVSERRISGSELTTSIRRDSVSVTGSAVTFNRGDKLYVELDVNAVAGSTIVGTVCFGGNNAGTRDGNIISPSIRLAGNLDTAIVSPQNNSKKVINTDFDVNVRGTCINYSCGDTNVTLRYCINPDSGCLQWLDMNTDPNSPLYISSGSYFRRDDLLDVSDTNYFVFTIKGTQTGKYTIRSKIDSIWSEDINYSNNSNGDINVTIKLPPNYAFSLSYPATGCTYGKGSIDEDSSCDRAYFEPTDLTGLSDQNKVDPQGQNSSTPFFVYDNQSTGENDMNFTLHLNSALPSTLKLKVSQSYNGWYLTCSGDPASNCVEIDSTPKNIGKAIYSTGTKDLNIFIFADFIGAGVGTTDRNAISTSIES